MLGTGTDPCFLEYIDPVHTRPLMIAPRLIIRKQSVKKTRPVCIRWRLSALPVIFIIYSARDVVYSFIPYTHTRGEDEMHADLIEENVSSLQETYINLYVGNLCEFQLIEILFYKNLASIQQIKMGNCLYQWWDDVMRLLRKTFSMRKRSAHCSCHASIFTAWNELIRL